MIRKFTLIFVGVLMGFGSCADKKGQENNETSLIFEKGKPTSKEKFVGNVYMNLLVPEDSLYQVKSGSVTFEKGARTNWHYHPSGQILYVTDGVGFHQIEGKKKEKIKRGDVIKIPANVKHWHGASNTEDMTHLFVIPNVNKGGSVWFEPVTDKVFNQ